MNKIANKITNRMPYKGHELNWYYTKGLEFVDYTYKGVTRIVVVKNPLLIEDTIKEDIEKQGGKINE